MIIKRYIVESMNEAMNKIRYELGSEAVIVSQRKIRQRGFTGLFKKRRIEVTAAVDDKIKNEKRNTKNVEEQKDVYKELDELKSMIQGLTEKKEVSMVKRENKSKFKQKLIDSEIDEGIIEELINKVRNSNKDKKVNGTIYEREVKKYIEELIKIDEDKNGRIHVLVGPTGVGKTTTIAKLASYYTLYGNKRVGLITLDTYRIGAVEQLKTYAEILGVPFGVILTSKDIPETIKKMDDCDIIFIDTTGRNSKNVMQISETRKYINEINPDKIHLTLSMTTKVKDLETIISNYSILNYTNIILTKIDETNRHGAILSCLMQSEVPISYLTFGQNVPEDIEAADKDKLVSLILGVE